MTPPVAYWTASPFYNTEEPIPIPNDTLETLPHLSLRFENIVQSETFDKVLKEILHVEEGMDVEILLQPNGENIKVRIGTEDEWVPIINTLGSREDIIEKTDLSDRLDSVIRELFCRTIENPRQRGDYINVDSAKYFQGNRINALIESNRTITVWSDNDKNVFEKLYHSIFSFIATYYYILKNAFV